MSIELLERAASALADLRDEVVFVGGATIVLWITDPAAPTPRPTIDVDVIVEVTTRPQLIRFDQALRDRGFREDRDSGIIGRWNHGTDLILDAIPADASLLGFENHWQRQALPHAQTRKLPSGTTIRAVSPPYLLATKLEAYTGRGQGDPFGSRDLTDVLALFDGRHELTAEIAAAPTDIRTYIADQLNTFTAMPRFLDAVHGSLAPDPASQARADTVIRPRIDAARHKPT
ncbi:nucleotidyl transferase AbiEii/AbiGii toxin family protein [Paraconexibacter antarcticus]|uniref:Nucleotidyl transferase AbiEii/AbiGii toxin family protein n=1 Tax=Paraconexibacter antarcticus TaxID=2949664 RepID=A0ABY5DX68_9ACTN|nr:nucleotidyl transferase AbiEii/AbiGii toxin family protein [Paraconexibacter antarcticus]UTI66281.1 nucleotidyl transferase AbiEii/AbiGii toxin family protein [Paraconexibacter antarcticus]